MTSRHSPTFLTRIVCLALLAGGLAASSAQGARIFGKGPEISIGRETASMVEQYLPVDRDPVAVARVRGIGRRLAACVRGVEYPFEFHVIEEGELNAFALPGGFVYIYRGLLQLMPSDDALASVLSHEMSHVTRRHAMRQFEKSLMISGAISALLRGAGIVGYRDTAGVVQEIVGISFTRHDETDADENGIRLLAEAGYDTRAAAESMRVLERAGGKDNTPLLLRTHPITKDRVTRLTRMSDELRKTEATRQAAAPPAPALPAATVPRLEGLDGFVPAPCDWFPLAAGARWSYVVRSTGSPAGDTARETLLAVRVLEPVKAEPSGVFRVEYEFSGGVKSTRLIAAGPDRLMSRGEAAGLRAAWKTEATFPSPAKASATCVALEKVQVPAGEFEAVRVETRGADGALESTAWYARGVGLVKRETPGPSGTIQELSGYAKPGETTAPLTPASETPVIVEGPAPG